MKINIKNLLLTGLISAYSILSAQEQIRVEGNIKNLSDQARVFVYKGNDIIDSLDVKNEKFTYLADAEAKEMPDRGVFVVSHDGSKPKSLRGKIDGIYVYMAPGTTTINATDSISGADISGTKINEEQQDFSKIFKPASEAMNEYWTYYEEASKEDQKTEAFAKKAEELSSRYDELKENAYTNFVKKYPDSQLSLTKLRENFQPNSSEEDFQISKKLYALLSPSLQQSEKGKEVARTLETASKISVGKKALEFTQNDVNGNPVSLSSFKGKYVLIDFWVSWCGPCRAENPHVVSAFNKFKDKGFTVLGVSLDKEEDRDKWLKAIEDDKLAWTQVSDLKYWKNEAAVLYSIRGIPANFLIDPNGIIVARNLRGAALTNKLEEILN